jgi:hypothetical protein
VLPENEAHPDEGLSHPPLISWLRYYPNPSRGQFTVELELREKIDIQLFLFDTASGVCVDRRTERDSDRYRIEYNVQRLNTGIYILMLTAGNERKQLKLLIE